jgi:UDP-N-acetylmuramoylalanine--D-glutamate ligase
MSGYVKVKKEIFKNQEQDGVAVVCVDDPYTKEICTEVSSRNSQTVVPISVGKALGRGVYVIDGVLYDGIMRPSSEVIDLKQAVALTGVHNWQNAAAAFAATRNFVRDRKRLGNALLSFPGLPHRLEEIVRIGDVKYVNDSKATNAEATANALSAFEGIYWILGGIPKDGGIETLRDYFPLIRKAYLIGAATEMFVKTLGDHVLHMKCKTLDVAVSEASKDARNASGEVRTVLLSPACSSFDQFRNFEARGDTFRKLVNKIHCTDISDMPSNGESAA